VKVILAAIVVAILSGCSTAVPIKRTFPEAPPILMRQCPNLQKLPEDTTKLSQVLTTVTQNYTQYSECQIILEKWQEWYSIQKIIFESAN
jgi:hypothetical protein